MNGPEVLVEYVNIVVVQEHRPAKQLRRDLGDVHAHLASADDTKFENACGHP
jgi:hypothetical protein